jgi:primosomal protein N' (replication factor Y)
VATLPEESDSAEILYQVLTSPSLTADVVVPTVDGEFSYRVPARLSHAVMPGVRVLVPFGFRRLTGYLVRASERDDARAVKEIEHVLDARPVFSPKLLEFTRWVSDYYLCPWGDVLKAALPAGMALDEQKYFVLDAGDEHPDLARLRATTGLEHNIIEALGKGPLSAEAMRKQFGLNARAAVLRHLQEAGLISHRPILRPPRIKSKFDSLVSLSVRARELYGADLFTQLRSVHEQHLLREIFEMGPDGILRSDLLKGANASRKKAFAHLLELSLIELRVEEVSRWDPSDEVIPSLVEPTQLTAEQIAATGEVTRALDRRQFAAFLLFGVTSSGKTQVYINAIRHTLEQGKTALVLLPEIALTPFVWGRFYKAFGDRVAIQHSAQSPAVRYDLWRQILEGKYPVVIGARSAVFAPLENLGLVVIDEEQESSYKQEEPSPRYHARDAALVRARMSDAVVVLGSATPSVETMHLAFSGRYKLLTLPERVGGAVLPEVKVISWKQKPEQAGESATELEPKARGKKKSATNVFELPILTTELVAAIGVTLEKRKQVVLLQNRRGFSPFLVCAECAYLPMCPNCSVSLTYHRKGSVLRCHYCDHREPLPDTCPRCASNDFTAQGLGTQRLEEEVAAHFPNARILRMDSDTVSRRGIHGRMVRAFANGDYDLLVGTQMIAKGLDFPGVDLAAVVQADAELFYPDFRASERGASLILQVSGRAGRRSERGTVIVQSNMPQHNVLKTAISGEWEPFVRGELHQRELGGFPPFARLVLVRTLSKDESAGVRALLRLRRLLVQQGIKDVLGPAPAVVARVKNLYRHQILVRSSRAEDPAGARLRSAVRAALAEYKLAKPEPGVHLGIDVDPQTIS